MQTQSTTRTIPLNQGYSAVVDEADYPLLSQYKWYATIRDKAVYATRNVSHRIGRGSVYMHHDILGLPPKGFDVHHFDNDGLNNQRSNLSLLSRLEHIQTQGPKRRGKSLYKGVWWHAAGQRWCAQVRHGSERLSLGSFTSEEEAARAYDSAVRALHGPLAFVNFPHPTSRQSL